jgi:hypothetical protein
MLTIWAGSFCLISTFLMTLKVGEVTAAASTGCCEQAIEACVRVGQRESVESGGTRKGAQREQRNCFQHGDNLKRGVA